MSKTNVDTGTTGSNIIWNDIILFGGAISCKLPTGYMDIANIRQVPDNQECYMELNLGDDSEEKASSVFIMEILEPPQNVEHDRIIEYLFHDLAESNGICENDDDVWDDEDNNEPRTLFFQPDHSNNESTTESLQIIPPNELFDLETETTENASTVFYRSGRAVQRVCRGNGNTNDKMETISIQMFIIRLLSQKSDILVTLTTPILRDCHNFPIVLQAQQQQTILFQHMISSIQIHDLTLFNP